MSPIDARVLAAAEALAAADDALARAPLGSEEEDAAEKLLQAAAVEVIAASRVRASLLAAGVTVHAGPMTCSTCDGDGKVCELCSLPIERCTDPPEAFMEQWLTKPCPDCVEREEARAEAKDDHDQGACDLATCRYCRGDEP